MNGAGGPVGAANERFCRVAIDRTGGTIYTITKEYWLGAGAVDLGTGEGGLAGAGRRCTAYN